MDDDHGQPVTVCGRGRSGLRVERERAGTARRVEQAVGDLTANEDLKAEGQVDEAGGKIEEAVGQLKRKTAAASEKIGEAVKR
jgi:uncharacterized protein YjbJ (UPF0337 family)